MTPVDWMRKLYFGVLVRSAMGQMEMSGKGKMRMDQVIRTRYSYWEGRRKRSGECRAVGKNCLLQP